MSIQQFFQTIKRNIERPATKPIRVRPGGYAPSTRITGQSVYPKAKASLSKSKYTKYIP